MAATTSPDVGRKPILGGIPFVDRFLLGDFTQFNLTYSRDRTDVTVTARGVDSPAV
ncbi:MULTISPECIES: hypothetical protein [unclassified Coleofasciculus]|uniref:hypothetical protein n=1 Tax=unclassified Coleofasciculus TaxID=2692782 RepID=UPI001881FAB0|nr:MULTISPECIES: hypothetical protein [unclassified Coleofasciculus]MBE9126510.1 hypothetical protein [Coleofasciculus sp. LEGE 07081]MBE9149893.1 hypothetical protein [Coleofasciculus sp. LEGE 07092]